LGLACSCRSEQHPDDPSKRGPSSSAEDSGSLDCGRAEEIQETIFFGATPYIGATAIGNEFRPIVEHLRKELDLPIEFLSVKSYSELIDMLVAGEVQMASLSPLSYVKAKGRAPCLRLLLTQVSGGSPYYSSYILVRSDSDIASVQDLKNKTFAFPSRSSASGYLFPMAFLLQRGIQPEEFFSRIDYSAGNHQTALNMLKERKCDATASFSWFVESERRKWTGKDGVKILAITGRIPHDAVCAAANLPADIADRVADTLFRLNTSTERGRMFLGRELEGLNGWIRTRDSVYDPLRENLALLRERGLE